VSALAAYEKARVELDRATGLLLENAGILVQDAERAQVTHMPKVPFVAARTDVQTQTQDNQSAPSQVPPQQP
jgi:hypothetical protein